MFKVKRIVKHSDLIRKQFITSHVCKIFRPISTDIEKQFEKEAN